MLTGLIGGIITIIFGILVLAIPKMLRYIVGFYLLVIGVIEVLGFFLF